MQDDVSGRYDDSTTEASTPDISPARREFLKASAAASAALLTGCLSENGDAPQATLGVVAPLSKFDHVVVAMFENRSFDSLIGHAYQPGEPPRNQTYNGVAGNVFRNPVPDYIKDGHAFVETRVSPGTDADMQNPNPDPGEEYEHVNTALFSVVNPLDNQFRDAKDMLPPYNAPAPGQLATMDGFVWDYCNNFHQLNNRNPTYDEYRVIMDGFSPEQLPVINALAKSFAVYD